MAATATASKNRKSANPKANAPKAATTASTMARVARRALNQNVTVERGIAIPEKGHKSKYPFQSMKFHGDTFLLDDCTDGNAAAIKQTAKTKFSMKLTSRRMPTADHPEAVRFWREDGPVNPAEASE